MFVQQSPGCRSRDLHSPPPRGNAAADLAEALARFDGVEAALAELKVRYPDPRISGKIDQILDVLAAGGKRGSRQ
jgi:hypothetical protein